MVHKEHVFKTNLRLWLQADNACKEVRNAATGQLACLLAQSGYFQTITQAHLQVGHTHEDVGKVNALMISKLVLGFIFLT